MSQKSAPDPELGPHQFSNHFTPLKNKTKKTFQIDFALICRKNILCLTTGSAESSPTFPVSG